MAETNYIHTCKKCGLTIDTGTNSNTPSSSGCSQGSHSWIATKYKK